MLINFFKKHPFSLKDRNSRSRRVAGYIAMGAVVLILAYVASFLINFRKLRHEKDLVPIDIICVSAICYDNGYTVECLATLEDSSLIISKLKVGEHKYKILAKQTSKKCE